MDDLEILWEQLQLTGEEDLAIDIKEEKVEDAQRKVDLCLISKVRGDRVLGKNIIETTMAKIWRLSAKAQFREVGSDIFFISFATHANKQRVEDGYPWLFDNNLFVLENYDGYTQLRSMKFDKVAQWSQFHDLPLAGMNRTCGEKNRELLDKVEEVDVDDHDIGQSHFLRVMIKLDLKRPIAVMDQTKP